jgi:hypothetical protein
MTSKLDFLCLGAMFASGLLCGMGLMFEPDKEKNTKNHCEQQLELVKQGAKQGVHEFLAEFGLEYRKKAK